MLLGSDNNDDKLFGAESDDTPKKDPNPSGFGSEKLFENSGNNSVSEDADDLVTDSFMLSMKANDPETVSEKLKDTAAAAESAPLFNDNATPSSDDLFGDDDELSNFEFDSSISAFKPLGGASAQTPAIKPEPAKSENVIKEAAPAAEPVSAPAVSEPKTESKKEEVKVEKPEPPLFIDDDPDLKAFAAGNEDPFKAGEDLDFAMSTKGNSNDFGTTPADAKQIDPLDDLELDDEALAISPFKPKNAPVAEVPKKEEPKAEPAEAPAAAPVAPAPAADKIDEAAQKETKEAKPSNLHTYGNVKSGVNAFSKKSEETKSPAKENKAAPKEAPKARPKSPFNKDQNNKAAPAAAPKGNEEQKAKTAPAAKAPSEAPAAKTAPKAEGRPAAAAHSPNTAPMPRPIPPTQRAPEKPAPAPVPPKAPAPAPQSQRTAAPQNAVVNQRPGTGSAPEGPKEPNPFAPKGAAPATRPAANTRPAAKQPPKHSTTSNIQPVTPVAKSGKADGGRKEPNKGGIIALIVAFLAVFLVVLGLENYDKLFGKAKPEETVVETTEEETTTTTEETTTEETTTEATTETTTEATTTETTEETTTEETTEETTVETTTEATTEATTAATTAASGTSSASYRYSIANPHSNGSEFSFDLVITDTGNADTNLTSSVDHLDITLSCTPDVDITSITSDYYTFTVDANDPYTFHGTPTSGTVPAGGALNTTITCSTSEPVQHFYITNYHFELK